MKKSLQNKIDKYLSECQEEYYATDTENLWSNSYWYNFKYFLVNKSNNKIEYAFKTQNEVEKFLDKCL